MPALRDQGAAGRQAQRPGRAAPGTVGPVGGGVQGADTVTVVVQGAAGGAQLIPAGDGPGDEGLIRRRPPQRDGLGPQRRRGVSAADHEAGRDGQARVGWRVGRQVQGQGLPLPRGQPEVPGGRDRHRTALAQVGPDVQERRRPVTCARRDLQGQAQVTAPAQPQELLMGRGAGKAQGVV
ncbi:hypothetical protein GCM10008956_09480 [Deinococcus arenae]|uniref:Uncharacterized protein n=1 Tax=Deinococcus arenae TaxID=1452751 RepID=A0A8H9GKI5_9DEIO|nr:hypothetical protein GCM10008956_09480 [Deinococcus arenae]